MQNLAKQQQTDLKNLLDNPNQELPKSLENVLIEDCLEEFKNNKEARDRYNYYTQSGIIFSFVERFDEFEICFTKNGKVTYINSVTEAPTLNKINFIQTLLSRTPEGEAVMPFLDVYTYYNDSITGTRKRGLLLLTNMQLAYMNNLYNGKTFDEALKIITKIYLINVYV